MKAQDLVGCLGFNSPLRQYFSLYRAVSQRDGERNGRREKKMSKQPPPARIAIALLLSKSVGRPGTESLPSTTNHPKSQDSILQISPDNFGITFLISPIKTYFFIRTFSCRIPNPPRNLFKKRHLNSGQPSPCLQFLKREGKQLVLEYFPKIFWSKNSEHFQG